MGCYLEPVQEGANETQHVAGIDFFLRFIATDDANTAGTCFQPYFCR